MAKIVHIKVETLKASMPRVLQYVACVLPAIINAICKDTFIVFELTSSFTLEMCLERDTLQTTTSQEYLTVMAPPRPRQFSATGAIFPSHLGVVQLRI